MSQESFRNSSFALSIERNVSLDSGNSRWIGLSKTKLIGLIKFVNEQRTGEGVRLSDKLTLPTAIGWCERSDLHGRSRCFLKRLQVRS